MEVFEKGVDGEIAAQDVVEESSGLVEGLRLAGS